MNPKKFFENDNVRFHEDNFAYAPKFYKSIRLLAYARLLQSNDPVGIYFKVNKSE